MAQKPAASDTATGPMVIAALEQTLPPDQRIIDDQLAKQFLPRSTQRIVEWCRWSGLRSTLVWLSEKTAPGAWGGMLGRKRFAEDALSAAINAGLDSVLVLGAGFDTKALRLAVPAGIRCFEVDFPDNISAKTTAIEHISGSVPELLHLVEIDFEKDSLGDVLRQRGFDASGRSFVIWEGVSQYLSEAAVRATLEQLRGLSAGSELVFTYVLADFISGAQSYGAEKTYRRFVEGYRVWHFGLMPETANALLQEFGWQVVDDAGSVEHQHRYISPTGRSIPTMQIERILLARKLG